MTFTPSRPWVQLFRDMLWAIWDTTEKVNKQNKSYQAWIVINLSGIREFYGK